MHLSLVCQASCLALSIPVDRTSASAQVKKPKHVPGSERTYQALVEFAQKSGL